MASYASHLYEQRFQRECAIVGSALLASASLLFVGILVAGSTADSTLVWAAFTGAILLSTIGWRLSRTGGAVFDPLTLFCLVLFAYYVGHSVWVVEQSSFAFVGIARPFRSALPRAQELMAFASVALVVGYFLTPRRRMSQASGSRGADLGAAPASLLLAIFAFGMTFQFLAHQAGNGGQTRNVLIYTTIGNVASAAFVLAIVKLSRTAGRSEARRLRLVVYWIMLPVQGLWALTEGHKLDLVVVVVTLLAAREALGHPFGLKRLALGSLLFLAILTPLVNDARQHRSSAHALIGTALVTDAVHGLMHPSLSVGGLFSRPWDLLQKRTGGIDSLALASKYTPALDGYLDGRSLAAVPLGLVPHFVWPGKPTYDVTREFSIVYAGQQASQGAGLTVAPTIPGDLYLNFGSVGVIGGFLLLGVALQLLTRMLEHGRPSDLRLLVYVSLLVPFILVEQDIATVAGRAIATAASAVLVAAFIRRFVRSEPPLAQCGEFT